MGYVPTRPPPAVSHQLQQLHAIYSVHLPPPDYSLIDGWEEPDRRGFTERYVTHLGYALLVSVFALIVVILQIGNQ